MKLTKVTLLLGYSLNRAPVWGSVNITTCFSFRFFFKLLPLRVVPTTSVACPSCCPCKSKELLKRRSYSSSWDRFWNRRKRCRCMLPSTMQSDKLLNGNIPSAQSCNSCAIALVKQLLLPFLALEELLGWMCCSFILWRVMNEVCVGVRIDAKKIHYMINRTQIPQLFVAKLLFKVGAQLFHATLQQKLEVGSTLFFE